MWLSFFFWGEKVLDLKHMAHSPHQISIQSQQLMFEPKECYNSRLWSIQVLLFKISLFIPKSNEISKQAVLALSSSYLTHLHQEQTVANLDY